MFHSWNSTHGELHRTAVIRALLDTHDGDVVRKGQQLTIIEPGLHKVQPDGREEVLVVYRHRHVLIADHFGLVDATAGRLREHADAPECMLRQQISIFHVRGYTHAPVGVGELMGTITPPPPPPHPAVAPPAGTGVPTHSATSAMAGTVRSCTSQNLPSCTSQASELAGIAMFEQFARRVAETFDRPIAGRCTLLDAAVSANPKSS